MREPVVIGDATLWHGDSLTVMQSMPDGEYDMILTDPPYSSGGMTRGDRMMSVASKYVQTGSERYRDGDFDGDNRDQRGWAYWCQLWLAECLRITRPGGYILMFTDWRQLPTATDAIQGGGWLWRGILAWDKGPSARAAASHYYRHQCEYVVWGTRGASPPREGWPKEGEGCYPGCYSVPVLQADKHHVTGKPTALLCDLMRCVPPGGVVLDPFAGSGTTIVAALTEGRKAVGIEINEAHFATACRRVEAAACEGPASLFRTGAAGLFDSAEGGEG